MTNINEWAHEVLYVTDLSYSILNEWYLTLFPSQPKRYINIKPLLNFIPIKVHRVFLSYNIVGVSSHHLIFYHHIYARELSIRSIFHAGRYLDDKEICYLGTVIVTANLCHSRNELINSGHISVLNYKHL